jgi:hypothetical protein
MAGEVDENIGLLGDFCSDQPLPNPLPGRCAGFDLRPMSFGLDMMSVERKHHPGGQMVAPGDPSLSRRQPAIRGTPPACR